MNFINTEKCAVLVLGDEGFNWPRGNLLRTWRRRAFVFIMPQSSRLQPILAKMIKKGGRYVEKENALFNSAIPYSRD